MLKYLASLAASLLCAVAVRAEPQLLEPCGEEVVAGYESRVDALIDGAVAGQRRLWFTTIPSFTPESGVRIVQRNGAYYAVHVTLQESVWHSSWQPPRADGRVDFELTDADIPVVVHEAEIDETLANRVSEVVISEIERAQAAEILGLDGETYYFRTHGSRCAKTWSPEPGSRQAKLVALMRGLASLAHTTTEQTRMRTLAAVDGLLSELAGQ